MARRQLLELGIGSRAITHRIGAGRLHVVHRGVYAVGHRALSREARWMAGVLACGPKAVLSHRCAGALIGLWQGGSQGVEVTVSGRWRSRRGITVHRTSLPSDEVDVVRAIPVTSVPRTLLDLATVLDSRHVERALREAEYRRLTDPLSLDALLDRYPRRHGSATIRSLLAARGIGDSISRSELEERFLAFLDAEAVPQPAVNTGISVDGRWFEADCVWPGRRLIVELDGRAAHGTAVAFERDRERDRILSAAGWTVIRITWRQLHTQGKEVAADLHALLRASSHRSVRAA